MLKSTIPQTPHPYNLDSCVIGRLDYCMSTLGVLSSFALPSYQNLLDQWGN